MGWTDHPVAQEFPALPSSVDDGGYDRGAFQFGENLHRNRGLECVGPEFVDGRRRCAGFDFLSETEEPGAIGPPVFEPIGIIQPGAGEVDARLWSAAIDSAPGGRNIWARYSCRFYAGPHVAGGN